MLNTIIALPLGFLSPSWKRAALVGMLVGILAASTRVGSLLSGHASANSAIAGSMAVFIEMVAAGLLSLGGHAARRIVHWRTSAQADAAVARTVVPHVDLTVEQKIQVMDKAVGRKSSIFLGLFGVSFLVFRFTGRRTGLEVMYLLCMLWPYALLTILLPAYLSGAKKALATGSFVSASGVERAQFWTKWTLRFWPVFFGLTVATLLLAVVEPITNRVFLPIDDNTTAYCRYNGDKSGLATFHCYGWELPRPQSSKELARLHASDVDWVCENTFFARFRRSAHAFRFIYSDKTQPDVTIDVSDKDCPHTPPQPTDR